ncbi:non-canonical purine NTP pyrophosphatase [uncultured Campylobacter sp.]|uniref:non-canonical purine NTP pyrophosphatase n=1 Tax=uncultured Campylobacter sp. TaxID=218934 RepID=UPI00260273E7|nr:non-canonical purine NTP pyrophosphatase [uncultured Campylobacter sp.]
MKILLATSNKNKVKEIKEFFTGYDVCALSEVLDPFEIDECGTSFKQNALIKVRAVHEALKSKNLQSEFFVLSDDSGICVDALGGAPGIFSARFSGEGATDASNREKLARKLRALSLDSSPAHYTAAIALKCDLGEFCTHGFMYGTAITKQRGHNGFGYDFMFVPRGFDRTIGELPAAVKFKISHRTKGLALMQILLKNLEKQMRLVKFH